jgi:hypothetical protein
MKARNSFDAGSPSSLRTGWPGLLLDAARADRQSALDAFRISKIGKIIGWRRPDFGKMPIP